MEWTPVIERLPEEVGMYDVIFDNDFSNAMRTFYVTKISGDFVWLNYSYRPITHWREIEPPKDQKQ